jgi:hypothetical protein
MRAVLSMLAEARTSANDTVLCVGDERVEVCAGFLGAVSPFLRKLFESESAQKFHNGLAVYKLGFDVSSLSARPLSLVMDVVYGESLFQNQSASAESVAWVCETVSAAFLADALCMAPVAEEFAQEASRVVRGHALAAHVLLLMTRHGVSSVPAFFESTCEAALVTVRENVRASPEAALWPYMSAERGGPKEGIDAGELVALSHASAAYKQWLFDQTAGYVSLEVKVKTACALGLSVEVDDGWMQQLTLEQAVRCWRAGALSDAEMLSLGRLAPETATSASAHSTHMKPLCRWKEILQARVDGHVKVCDTDDLTVFYVHRAALPQDLTSSCGSYEHRIRLSEGPGGLLHVSTVFSTLPGDWDTRVVTERVAFNNSVACFSTKTANMSRAVCKMRMFDVQRTLPVFALVVRTIESVN